MNTLVDLARVTTPTVGTGSVALGAAVPGFLTFAQSGVPDGATVSYGLADGPRSEVGWGVYNAAGTLSRNVYRSTGSGNNTPIALSGAGQVFITALAEDFTPPKYVIGFSYVGGVLGASQLIGLHRAAKAIQIPANFGTTNAGYASLGGATVNATASTVITVARALAATPSTFATIGTITFAAGALIATFASTGGAAVNIAQGDVLRLMGPATADATLANPYLTLSAMEI